MVQRTDVLGEVEARLSFLSRRVGGGRMEMWAGVCPSLRVSGVRSPSGIAAWVWGLRSTEQDRVLRALVHFAQADDELALLVVIACLRPGLLRLARRARVPVDDVVAEAAVRVLEYPVERRRRVAAGLVMDVRYGFWYQRQREPDVVLADPEELRALEPQAALGSGGDDQSAGEELAAAVVDAWRAGLLDEDDARLIIETRVLGETVEAAGRRRSLQRRAAFWRREQAEARLIGGQAASVA